MARLRLLCVAVITVLSLGVSAGSSSALSAHPSTSKSVHRAAGCGKAAHSRKKHARGVRYSEHRGHASCRKHHARTVKHSIHKSAVHRARSKSADNGGCADAGLAPTTQDLERIRAATLCLVNRERAGHGENALIANSDLQQAAQGHTTSMVVDDYFGHIGPGGATLLQRVRAAGYIDNSETGFAVGENIAWGILSLGTPAATVAAWMASPGHRANILDGHFKETGIGVSAHPPSGLGGGQSGGVYTEDFGVIARR